MLSWLPGWNLFQTEEWFRPGKCTRSILKIWAGLTAVYHVIMDWKIHSWWIRHNPTEHTRGITWNIIPLQNMVVQFVMGDRGGLWIWMKRLAEIFVSTGHIHCFLNPIFSLHAENVILPFTTNPGSLREPLFFIRGRTFSAGKDVSDVTRHGALEGSSDPT